MSRLERAKPPEDGAVIITVAGDAGVGKTSFAATFPNPIFIQAEQGMQSIAADHRPDALPAIKTHEGLGDFWADLGSLIRDEHDYKTLVIDSVTALDSLFIAELLSGGAKSIAEAGGGYGAGFQIIAAQHQRVRKAAGMLRDRGMNVVFIAHTDTERVDPPDGKEYTRTSLRLHRGSMQPYIDNVDAVALIKLQAFSKDSERKGGTGKAFSTGTRIMTLTTSVAHVSKNRFGITEDLELQPGVNPLVPFVKSLQTQE